MFEVENSLQGVMFKNKNQLIMIEPLEGNIVRIRCTTKEKFKCNESIIIDSFPTLCSYNLGETCESFIIRTQKLQIVLDKKCGKISYKRMDGTVITTQTPFEGMEEFEVYKAVLAKEREKVESADGERVETKEVGNVFDKNLYRVKVGFEFNGDEAIFGFGSHEEGFGNLRGKHRELYQHNMKVCVPCFLSTNGYGCLFNAGCYMEFHDDEDGSYVWLDGIEELDYFTIFADDLDGIVSGFALLTGKSAMLPRYAFGYWQSRERYKTAEELIWAVEEYRKRKVPLDVIVLDWKSWPMNLWGQKSFDNERFNDPKKMTDTIHELGARLMMSIWPNPCVGSPDQKELMENGCVLTDNSTYDAFSEKAREIYWEQLKKGLFNYGVDAWWCDSSEPVVADWKGEVKLPLSDRVRINVELLRRYMDYRHINEYSMYHSKGIFEGQRKECDRRVLNLTRSSYAGQHRYGTVVWSGDITATWETLKRQIPEGLNYTATGEAYWSTDIGAFFVKKSARWFWKGDYNEGCDDFGYRELYTRWIQYGTFLPIMRSHGTDTNREIWNFGEKGEMFYDAIEKFIRLRYRLLPYIYSLAGKVTLEGYTMMRHLAFDFLKDKNTYDVSHQFMFGPSFLVAPVYKPMYYGKNSKKLECDLSFNVYLPEGCGWYDFWSDEFYEGGITITKNYPIDIMPLFVKEGSIVPMAEVGQNTEDTINNPYEIYVYQGRDASFTIYEDEGDNYNYEKDCYSLIDLFWNEKEQTLTIGKRKGVFDGYMKERHCKVIVVGKEGKREQNIIYSSEEMIINFKEDSE